MNTNEQCVVVTRGVKCQRPAWATVSHEAVPNSGRRCCKEHARQFNTAVQHAAGWRVAEDSRTPGEPK